MEISSVEIRKRYNKEAPGYDSKMCVIEYITGIRKIRGKLLQQACGEVLAVAIGTGRDLPLFPSNCDITGIDLVEDMLKIARKRAEELNRKVELAEMDAEALSFPDHSFDTVVSTLGLCTYAHPLAALSEMNRVCKPNGKILLLEHGRSTVSGLGWLQDALNDRWCRKVSCQINRQPDVLVREAGLTINSNTRSFFGIIHTIVAHPSSSLDAGRMATEHA